MDTHQAIVDPAPPPAAAGPPRQEPGLVVVRGTRELPLQQEILVGGHRLIADEPVTVGGRDSGPIPMTICSPRSVPAPP